MVLFWLTFMSKMPLISILLRSEMELIVLGIAEGLTFVD